MTSAGPVTGCNSIHLNGNNLIIEKTAATNMTFRGQKQNKIE